MAGGTTATELAFVDAMLGELGLSGATVAGAGGAGIGTTFGGGGDAAGLAQMGRDAGLSGAELQKFVASGGTMGSTAAGGGGVGTGATGNFFSNAGGELSSWLDKLSTNFSTSPLKTAYSLASPLSSIYSGIQGLSSADEMRKRAQMAQMQGNPWGSGGGQAMANQQLMDLMANPSMVASNDPAYKLRIQGAQRATATQGQGSGAMAVAGANASTDWYNGRLQQLGVLAGAPGNPVGAAQIGLQGDMAAADLQSRGLASIGFGTNTIGGGGAGAALPASYYDWLRATGRPAY